MVSAGFGVQWIEEDPQSVTLANKAAETLGKADKVAAVLGAETSGVTKAAGSVTVPTHTLMISPSAALPELTMSSAEEGKDLLSRTCPSAILVGIRVEGVGRQPVLNRLWHGFRQLLRPGTG